MRGRRGPARRAEGASALSSGSSCQPMSGAPGSGLRPLEASQMSSCRLLQQAAPAARQRRATPVVTAAREKPAWSDRSGRSHRMMEGRRHRKGTQAGATDSPGARTADPRDSPASRRSAARTRGRPAGARREPRTRSPSRSPGRRRRAARAGPKRRRRHRRRPRIRLRRAAVSRAKYPGSTGRLLRSFLGQR
jgi:hypothetical protein